MEGTEFLFKKIKQINELILTAAAEGILGLDTNGKHLFANLAAATMLGYKVDELTGNTSHQIWHHTKADGSPYLETECPIHATYKDGTAHTITNEVFCRRDGTMFPVEYTSAPIFEENKLAGALVTFKDITEKKQAQESLRSAYEQLQAMQRTFVQKEKASAVAQLARGLVHEINNPLTGVLNNVQLIKLEADMKKGSSIDEYRELLDTVEESALRCKRIVQAVSEFSQVSGGEFEVVDLIELTQKAVLKMEEELSSGGIRILKDIQPGVPKISADPRLLTQALLYILRNAAWAIEQKKTGEQGGVITVKAGMSCDKKYIVIQISDEGIGIPKENIEKIFEPFFSTKPSSQGIGLSLATVLSIMKLHNAAIEAQSELGKGATFKLQFPL